ncbi:MAG: response regulator [Myxococcales bacterium]|nr:response regulator [Myxococcales bacterium]
MSSSGATRARRLAGWLFLDVPDRLLSPQVLEGGGESLRRARLLMRVGLFGGLLMLAPLIEHVAAGKLREALVLGVCWVMTVAMLAALRLGLRPYVAGHLAAITLLLSPLLNAETLGGIHSPPIFALLSIPLLMIFASGITAGWLWVGVVVAALVWITAHTGGDVQAAREKLVATSVFACVLACVGTIFEVIRARSQAELLAARDAAEAAAEAKGLFLATMSHEIRTPLNGVIGMADLLRASELDGRQREYATIIYRSSRALLQIINDILDYSKIEADALTLERVPSSLRDVARDAMNMLRVDAERKDLKLEIKIPDSVPKVLEFDPTRIRQVLINLVSNAVKFTSRGGVTVAARAVARTPDALTLRVEVRDTGIGISPEQQGRIFGRFVQADPSTTRKFGGTGLGLAIARRLVELHGGEIGLESEVGRGTTFWFTLPARVLGDDIAIDASTSGSGRDVSEAAAPPIREGLHVLVAEDNKVNQLVARRLLDQLGVGVELVSDGVEAVKRAREREFDLILMDIHMPNLDGIEATRQLTADPETREVPVVLLSASVLDDDVERGREAGAVGFASKPMNLRSLTRVLAEHVDRDPNERGPFRPGGTFDLRSSHGMSTQPSEPG